MYVCNLEENLLFSTLIFGSVFNDYVVFYADLKICRSPSVLLWLRTITIDETCLAIIRFINTRI